MHIEDSPHKPLEEVAKAQHRASSLLLTTDEFIFIQALGAVVGSLTWSYSAYTVSFQIATLVETFKS